MFVIGVNPAFGSIDMVKTMNIKGKFAKTRKVLKVQENNWAITTNGGWLSTLALVKMIKENKGTPSNKCHVVGWSRGGQLIDAAIRMFTQEMLDAGVDPAATVFWTLGNPEQDYTGSAIMFPAPGQVTPIYPGNTAHTGSCLVPAEFHGGYRVGYGLPATHPWTVKRVSNEYDGWSDFPAGYANAIFNSPTFLGMPTGPRWFSITDVLARTRQGVGPHGKYGRDFFANTDPDDLAYDPLKVKTYVNLARPNEEYLWVQTYPYPPADQQKTLRFSARNNDYSGRVLWNAQYTNRPVSMIMPDYPSIPSWIQYRG